VIEWDIVPKTRAEVVTGSKVFGAAVLRMTDLSLVLAETNHEAYSPLWHGEIYTIKMFYEKQGHPNATDCIFLSTHQPCCMCASALAWAGFQEIYYLFGYSHTETDFNIPHDRRMIHELFGCKEPAPENYYFKWYSIPDMAKNMPDPETANKRIERIKATYAELSKIYQSGEKSMVLQ
jgi:tRNA(Arg) A34 adenosine deaminase TadA